MSRLLLLGHGGHGKDTVAEMMQDQYAISFKSSSLAASEIFIYDHLKDKYSYRSPEECYADRRNKRDEWHDLICWYNREDKARLAKEILKRNDMYVGMRDDRECEESMQQGLFDLILGVFDPRKPLEPKSSFSIDMWKLCHIVIPNGGTLEELRAKVNKLSGIHYDISRID